MRRLEIISVGDELYQVVRVLRYEEKWDVHILKQLWNCDTAFKKDGMLYFVRDITTVEDIYRKQ